MKETNENQRVVLTKRLLREGLLQLLQEKSLDKINVSELCRRSGINRATFYKHYVTPNDVLKDMEGELAREMICLAKKPDSLEEGQVFLEQVCTHLYNHREIAKILIRCNLDTDFASVLNEFNRNLWEGRSKFRRLRSLDVDSMRLVSAFLGSGGYFLIRQWLMEDIPKTPKEVAALIVRLLGMTDVPR